jgi:hypothetical protein
MLKYFFSSKFKIRHSSFRVLFRPIRRSTFDVERSAFDVRRSLARVSARQKVWCYSYRRNKEVIHENYSVSLPGSA